MKILIVDQINYFNCIYFIFKKLINPKLKIFCFKNNFIRLKFFKIFEFNFNNIFNSENLNMGLFVRYYELDSLINNIFNKSHEPKDINFELFIKKNLSNIVEKKGMYELIYKINLINNNFSKINYSIVFYTDFLFFNELINQYARNKKILLKYSVKCYFFNNLLFSLFKNYYNFKKSIKNLILPSYNNTKKYFFIEKKNHYLCLDIYNQNYTNNNQFFYSELGIVQHPFNLTDNTIYLCSRDDYDYFKYTNNTNVIRMSSLNKDFTYNNFNIDHLNNMNNYEKSKYLTYFNIYKNYHNFFNNYKIKIFVTTNIFEPKIAPIYKAAKDASTILCIKQSSHEDLNTYFTHCYADIFFKFNNFYSSFDLSNIKKNNFENINYDVVVGYPYKINDIQIKKEASDIKSKFNKTGITKIIGYFDAYQNINAYLHNKEFIINDIIFLLDKISNNNYGLVIKTKKDTFIDECPLFLKNRINKLISDNKIIILSSANGRIKPCVASHICDVIIHSSGWSITAAVESLLLNKLTLVLNRDNWDEGLSRDLKENNQIFDNINDLWKFIITSKFDIKTLNEKKLNNIIKKIDPFNDDLGEERINFFLNLLNSYLNDNLSKNEAIDRTTREYILQYGKDKIIKKQYKNETTN